MTNTFSSSAPGQVTFEHLKNLKNATIVKAGKLMSGAEQMRSAAFNASKTLEAKLSQLKRVEEDVIKKTVTETVEAKPETPIQPAQVQQQPETVIEVPKKPTENKPQPQQSSAKQEQKPVSAQKPQQPQQQKPVAAQPVIQEGQKTYTDEKGNIKVRRFLSDLNPPRSEPQRTYDNRSGARPPYNNTQDPNRRPPYNNNYDPNRRPPYDSNRAGGPRPPYDSNRPGGQRPPFDNNRSGGFRSGENAAGTNRFGSQSQSSSPLGGMKPAMKKPLDTGVAPRTQPGKSFGNKNKTPEKPDEKKTLNKRSLVLRAYEDGTFSDEDERAAARRPRPKKQEVKFEPIIKVIDKAVVNTTEVPIKLLSEKIGVTAVEIIKYLFKEGIIKTINDTIDFDYAAVIASSFKVELELKMDQTFEEKMLAFSGDTDELPDNQKRAPIVTIMGHVDHGKTSLLDKIRSASVTSVEAGGITQHIGAYTTSALGQSITFIDTPGHEAFTAMRARGAKVTDVAVIVIAADDGIMPQTIEAINHAKAAEVSIIVAINKVDKPEANPDRIKQQLTEQNLVPEEWGGDVIVVPVSAKTGAGISQLLESIVLLTDIKELKANPDKKATGTAIEARLDKGRGPIATVLVQNGTLRVGDHVVAGTTVGKIRAMFDDKGKSVRAATPSQPVEVLGFSEVPNAGDFLYVVNEKLAKQVADERKNKEKMERISAQSAMSLDDMMGKINQGLLKNLNIIIKSDVQGSLEALKISLNKITNDEVRVVPIHGGVGAITETDIMLAKASNAIIIGFNVRPDVNARAVAETEGVDIRLYSVIYEAVDDITLAVKGMLKPKFKVNSIGSVSVRNVFKITGSGIIAGCYVTNGKVMRNCSVKVLRDNVVVGETTISSLKRFKDDVREVASGYECGISLNNFSDIAVGDEFEVFQMEEIKQ